MKKFIMAFIALVTALLIAATLPAQVFADSIPEYISEVKIGMGKDGKSARAALSDYKILSDDKGNPVDLNQKAGGSLGSKGDKVVYLGYKTTADRDEAITDLALMNMKGGYSVQEYEALMETQMKSRIIPFVERFQAAIDEYRENLKSDNEANRQRAEYVKSILNKFIDDDTGKGLGDLLVNKTKFELGGAYDKLSAEEKKNHADILTILAQSNGKATLMMENLITRAADTKDDTWIDRFTSIDYDKLLNTYAEELNLLPSDAEAELAKLYDDDAGTLSEMFEEFREGLLKYDEYKEFTEEYDENAVKKAVDAAEKVNKTVSDEEIGEIVEEYTDAQNDSGEYMLAVSYMYIHDRFENIGYGDGSLLDFFTQDMENINEDISVLYPLVASFTDGQRAGLEFVSLREFAMVALSDERDYQAEDLSGMKELSIYDGVDRGIYEKGGVALTSDAMRTDAQAQTAEDDFSFSRWTIASAVITGACIVTVIGTAIASSVYRSMSNKIGSIISNSLRTNTNVSQYLLNAKDVVKSGAKPRWLDTVYANKSSMCKGLAIGFTVAAVIIAGVTTYLAYRDLVDYYKVDFTPIPHYMVDEKDITAYNDRGEKIVLKNQSVYYKAVECNRSSSDEFFGTLGTCADMNGDVGKQWLALYAQKSDALPPILASSLIVKVNDKNIPADYKTGIHMFGSSSAFNLNNELYDWNKDAPSVMIYFKADEAAAKPASTASNFSAGNLALAGVAGLAVGAVVTALASKAVGRKKEQAA